MKMKVERWYEGTYFTRGGSVDRFSWRVWCPKCRIDSKFTQWDFAIAITDMHLRQHRLHGHRSVN